MTRKLIMAAVALVAAAAGWFGAIAATAPDEPYCPQEDSCWVDYSDGRWTVYEE